MKTKGNHPAEAFPSAQQGSLSLKVSGEEELAQLYRSRVGRILDKQEEETVAPWRVEVGGITKRSGHRVKRRPRMHNLREMKW